MAIPQTFHYPDDWSLCVEIGGKQDWISIQKAIYRRCKIGEKVEADYVIGRVTRELYIKEIYY